jgi:hypothetical protein
VNQASAIFQHVPHMRTRSRLSGEAAPPPMVNDERVGINGRLGLLITTVVGTMWAAYVFGLVALISLPSAIRSDNILILIAWIAQTFLQLVLLPIIIVGQNIQAKVSDKRAEETYKDGEAGLHEIIQIQEHLTAQDNAQTAQMKELKALIAELRGEPGPDASRPDSSPT